GSLGDLVFYSYYKIGEIGKTCLTVLAPSDLEIESMLKTVGVTSSTYNFIALDKSTDLVDNTLSIQIQPVGTTHVPELKSYSYFIILEGLRIFYSGDANKISDFILEELINNK